MRTDLIIGAVAALGLHAGFIYGGEIIFGKEKVEVTQEVITEVSLINQEEEPPPPPPVVEGEESDQPAEILPEEFLAATIGEPPPSATAMGALVQVVRPDRPRPPRPDGMDRFSVPTGAQTAAQAAGDAALSIFDISQLDSQPVPTVRVPPTYPFALARAGTPGNVVARLLVNEQGRVIEVVVESSTHREFEKPAIDALYKWRFTQGLKDGKPVQFYMRQPLNFTQRN